MIVWTIVSLVDGVRGNYTVHGGGGVIPSWDGSCSYTHNTYIYDIIILEHKTAERGAKTFLVGPILYHHPVYQVTGPGGTGDN